MKTRNSNIKKNQSIESADSSYRGFTLLEIIVAVSIMGLLAVLVFSSLRMALNSYDRGQGRIEAEAISRALENHMKRQIASLYPLVPSGGMGFSEQGNNAGINSPMIRLSTSDGSANRLQQPVLFYGQPDSMTFISVVPLVHVNSPGLVIVRYGLARDEFGNLYLGAMELPYTGLESFLMMSESPQGKPLPIIEGVERVEFSYYGFDPVRQSYSWYQHWNGSEAMAVPSAVRIEHGDSVTFVQINAEYSPNTGAGRSIRDILSQHPQLQGSIR
ncbi:MAG: prepilin-type N-terminal cleavage/methylation domain-containing protein [Acidobacteriota bacterium]